MAEHENGEAHEAENSKLDEEQEEGDEGDGGGGASEGELGGQVGESRPVEVESFVGAGEAKVKDSDLETLGRPSALQSSSLNGQSEGLLEISASQSSGVPGVKDQAGVSHDGVPVCATSQAARAQTESQLQLSTCVTPPSQQSPTSVTQSISSAPSPTLLEQRKLPPLKIIKECKPEPNPLKSSKTAPSLPTVRTPSSDGYNWRKYGQKQVKSPKGSRSYYRCTHAECCSKKIECCDHSGHVTEIVYKSQHSHDPPRKINSTRESKAVSSAEPVVRNIITECSNRIINDSDPSTSSKEHVQDTTSVPERKRQYPSDLVKKVENIVKEENASEPEPKRREKKSNVECPDSVVKVGKKPKFVVHAAGDVGISSDGYRWRKYGQKMVKGNSHPRNYYRCTSAGCPVRKHIETAVDNPNAVIITYKGIHDHDKPVPKKRHGPPSVSLVAVAAPKSMNNIQMKKTDTASTQWSVDPEGELTGEALDLGGEKAMESARTLLSIGFEIKPC